MKNSIEERALMALIEKQDRDNEYLTLEVERLSAGWPELYRLLFPQAVDSSCRSLSTALAGIRWLRQKANLAESQNAGQKHD